MNSLRYSILTLLILALTTPAKAQIEGVQSLKYILKEVLQKEGARSLKKKLVEPSAEDSETIQNEYGFAPNPSYVIYTGLDADKNPIGSAIQVDIEGKEGPLQLVVALDHNSGEIYNFAFTLFGEERGKPAAQKSFMEQFIGFTIANEFKLGEDVDGVSGATWTSTSVTEGIQHAVGVFDYFVLNQSEMASREDN